MKWTSTQEPQKSCFFRLVSSWSYTRQEFNNVEILQLSKKIFSSITLTPCQRRSFKFHFPAYFSSFVSISSWQVFLPSKAIFYCVFIKVLHILFILFFCTVFFSFVYQNINRLQVLFSVLSVDVDLIWLTQNNQNFQLKNQNILGEFKSLKYIL